MHGRIELLQGFALAGQPGDVEQGRLDHFRTLALADFLAQLGGALVDHALQFHGLRTPRQRLPDMFRHEGHQVEIGLRIALVGQIALDDQTADHRALVQHRYAHPVHAFRAELAVPGQSEAVEQGFGAVPGELLGLEHGQRDAVGQHAFVPFDVGIDRFLVDAVGVIQELHGLLAFVEVHDEEVFGVDQTGDDLVQFPEQDGGVVLVVSQIADVEQGLLQLFGFHQLLLLKIALIPGQQIAQHRGGGVQFFLHVRRHDARAIHIEDEMGVPVTCQNHRRLAPSGEIFGRGAFEAADVLHAQDRQGLMAQYLVMR